MKDRILKRFNDELAALERELKFELPKEIREAFPEARSDAQACLQFVRSTAGVTSAVVGMREPEHVEDDLALALVPPADPSIPVELFRRFAARS